MKQKQSQSVQNTFIVAIDGDNLRPVSSGAAPVRSLSGGGSGPILCGRLSAPVLCRKKKQTIKHHFCVLKPDNVLNSALKHSPVLTVAAAAAVATQTKKRYNHVKLVVIQIVPFSL